MTHNSNIRILMVEDHPLYRAGLRMALSFADIDCVMVAEAETAAKAIDFIERRHTEIDLVLLDYYLPDGNGLDVLRAAKAVTPELKVLLVSGEYNNPEMDALLQAGLNGYASKDITPEGLSTVIRSIFQGQAFVREDTGFGKADGGPSVEAFSQRELDIIRMSASGKSSKEIGEALFISPRTVESHKHNIFSKLGCNSTTEMLNYAFLHGLV